MYHVRIVLYSKQPTNLRDDVACADDDVAVFLNVTRSISLCTTTISILICRLPTYASVKGALVSRGGQMGVPPDGK